MASGIRSIYLIVKISNESRPITIIVKEDNSDFDLSAEMKAVLDERVQEDESSYLSAKKSINQIKKRVIKQVVLNVPDNKYPFFMELVKSLGYVKVSEELKLNKKQKDFVVGTKNSLEQVEQHLKGNIKLKTADQLYNEL